MLTGEDAEKCTAVTHFRAELISSTGLVLAII